MRVWELQEVYPDPKRVERVLPRCDCAVGYLQDDYALPGLPRLTFIARVKPKKHHSKAGNLNNAIYNTDAKGDYVVIFDNDMQPHPQFCVSTLPLFFERVGGSASGRDSGCDDRVRITSPWASSSGMRTMMFFRVVKTDV